MSWILPNFIAIASLGYFVALFHIQEMGKLYIILIIGPLLLARHSFQLYQKSQIQYYKTIKALTATIEAKDPYTEGLKGEEVPIEAYILSAADAFDAMTSHRPYRDAMEVDKAMNILMENRGSHFHPQVVDIFLKVLKMNTVKEGVIG